MALVTGPVADWVRQVAGTHDPRVGPSTPVAQFTTPEVITRPSHPGAVRTYVCGGCAVKIHASDIEPAVLARRLEVIDGPELDRFWMHPLTRGFYPAPGGGVGTMWPRVTLVSTIEHPPWADAGALLARLHTAPVDPKLPPHGGVGRFRQAVEMARALEGYGWLADLGETLVDRIIPAERPTLVHGSWHLGHIGHPLLSKRWRLLDPDLLGLGNPGWDLAMPAGYQAAGLLADEDWEAFLGGYRELGGVFDAEESRDLVRAALFIAAVRELTVPDGGKATTLLAALQVG
ncbi:MAG: hypothetical protein LBR58_07005 [Propionibacteriaceae bacterium]|nr:hypothetical protein [Propionibacteriaceae bacterium]